MIYLDNAATTFPKPPSVISEAERCLREYCGNPGRGSHRMALKAAEAVYTCRETICEEFGGQPENVVFTQNATHALNIAIKSFARKTVGGHILISAIEHNSVFRPVASVCADSSLGFEYSVFDVPTAPCHERTLIRIIEDCLRDDTRILVAAHASNICGITLPIREIGKLCRKRGIYFIVDASQSAGMYDIDLEAYCIDALCCPGHKSLYGIQGSGFVLFSSRCSGDFWNGITYAEGGSGSASLDIAMPTELPEHFEAGTLNTPAIAALTQGIKFVRHHRDELRYRKSLLIRSMRNVLANTPHVTVYVPHFDDSSILLFNLDNIPPTEVSSRLDSRGICVRSGFHCSPLAHKLLATGENGAVRVSVGAFNGQREIDEACREIRKMINDK